MSVRPPGRRRAPRGRRARPRAPRRGAASRRPGRRPQVPAAGRSGRRGCSDRPATPCSGSRTPRTVASSTESRCPVRAGSSSGQSRSQSRSRVTTRPRCAARTLTRVRACRDRQAGSGTSLPSTTTRNGPKTQTVMDPGGPPPALPPAVAQLTLPAGGVRPRCRKARIAARAQARSAPSASGRPPISACTRARSGPAPPRRPDRERLAERGAGPGLVIARCGFQLECVGEQVSRSDVTGRGDSLAGEGRRSLSIAVGEATRPLAVSAQRSHRVVGERDGLGCRRLRRGGLVVRGEQSETAESRAPAPGRRRTAAQLDRLTVGGEAALPVPPQPVDTGDADQTQRGAGRSQPTAQRHRALEVPERFVELAGAGERLAQVVQGRGLQPRWSSQPGHPGGLPGADLAAWSKRAAASSR